MNLGPLHSLFSPKGFLVVPFAVVVASLLVGIFSGSFFGLGQGVSAQGSAGGSGNATSTPFTSTNLPGGVEDPNVARSSGKVLLNLPLGSLQDGSSPQFTLKAHYNSNVENNVKIWNRDYQASDLGLGWTIPKARIVRFTQETGNEEDDTYFYTSPDGSQTVRLKYEGTNPNDSSVRTYSIEHRYTPAMVIEHHTYHDIGQDQNSYWRAVHPDGSIAYYGGDWGKEGSSKSHEYNEVCGHITNGGHAEAAVASCASGPVEMGVRWGNWIGPSYEATNQEQFELAWHLSAIEDVMGNQTTFSYIQHVQNVGDDASAKSFGKQAYLYRVQQASDNKLVLRYCPRAKGDSGSPSGSAPGPSSGGEYVVDPAVCPLPEQEYVEFFDPWQLNEEPDGYQERYSTLYLRAVDHRVDPTNTNLTIPTTRAQLGHEFLTVKDEAEMAKRILTSVTPMVYDTTLEKLVETAPPTLYGYWGQDGDDGVSVAVDTIENMFSSANGALYGALKSITSSQGGTKLYTYQENILEVPRHILVEDFNGKDTQFPLFGPGYILIVGKQKDTNNLLINAYRWTQSGWKKRRVYKGGHYPENYNPFRMVAMQQDFIAFVHSDRKTVSYVRNNPLADRWDTPKQIHQFPESSDYMQLAAGRDFLAIISSTLRDPDYGNGEGHYQAMLGPTNYALFTSSDRAVTWHKRSHRVIQQPYADPDSWATYAVGVGAGPNYVVLARAYLNGTDLDVVTQITYSDEQGTWRTVGDRVFSVPNVYVSEGFLCTGETQSWWSEISDIHLASSIDIQVSGSMIGVAINNLQNEVGRQDNEDDWRNKAQYTFGIRDYDYPDYEFSRPVLYLSFDSSNGRLDRTFAPDKKYSQLPVLDMFGFRYGGSSPIVQYGESDDGFYGLGSKCTQTLVSSATTYGTVGPASMTTVTTGFTKGAYGLLYDPDLSGALDPHIDHYKVSQLAAKCLFGYFDGKNTHLEQVLRANPERDLSPWRWHGKSLRDDIPSIVDDQKDYRYGREANSRSDISGSVPCATSETYLLPGGLAVYTDKDGNRQYLIADPKTKTHRSISVSADRQPYRASNLKAWDEYDKALDELHLVNGILGDINMAMMVIGLAMGMADPVSAGITGGFLAVGAATQLAGYWEGQLMQAAMEAALDKLSGPAPAQFGSRGLFIQDGDTLLRRNADATLTTVTEEIDVNQLYNGNFSSTQNYLVYTTATGSSTADIGDTKLRVLRNGAMSKLETNIGQELGVSNLINRSPFNDAYYPLANSDTFVTYVADQDEWTCPVKGNGVYSTHDQRVYDSAKGFLPNTDDGPCFTNTKKAIYLHKFIDDNAVGKITDYAVKTVTIDDGFQKINTDYEYDLTEAGFDTLTTSGIYSEVTVHPGGQNSGHGKTVYDYLVDTTDLTIEACDYDLQQAPPAPENCEDATSDSYFGTLTGTHYRTSVYDGAGNVVSRTANKPRVLVITDGTEVRYHSDTISRTSSKDAVAMTTSYQYDEYLQHAGNTKTTLMYDPILRSATSETITTQKRRAYLDYPEMKAANILSPLSLVTTTRKIGDGTAEAISGRKTTYKNWRGSDGRGWLSETTQRLDREAGQVSGEYTIINTVERDPRHGLVTKSTDIDGVVTSHLYSNDGSNHAYASYTNADFAATHASYYGFAFYEPTASESNWNFTGGAVSDIFENTGSKSYGSEDSSIAINPKRMSRVDDGYMVASAWVLPNDGQTCSVVMGEKTGLSEVGDGLWQYIEVTNNNGALAFYCNGYIDDLRFGPVDGAFSAMVYDDRRKTVASHGNNGQLTRNIYDGRERLFAVISADDAVGNISPVLGSHGFSRFGGSSQNEFSYPNTSSSFDPAVPNSTYALTFQEPTGNVFDDFNERWVLGTELPKVGNSFAVHALFAADSNVVIKAGSGRSAIELRYSSTSRAFDLNGETSEAIGADSIQPSLITLVVVEEAGFAFGDGRLLVTNDSLPKLTGEDNPVNYIGTVSRFLVGKHPLLKIAYQDGLGRVIQTQRLGLDESNNPATTVASGTLYDGWGRAAVHTLNMEYEHIPSGYQPALVSTFDWDGAGTMTGDVVDYYHTGGGADLVQGDDYQYPYLYSTVQMSPLVRPNRSSTGPGEVYAVGNDLSVSQKYQSPDEGATYLRSLEIHQPNTHFHVRTTHTPFSPTKTVRRQMISDVQGRVVASRVGNEADGYLETANHYRYNLPESISEVYNYQPNYFGLTDPHQASTFFTHHTVKDTAGLVTTSQEPDLIGLAYQIRDKAGRVRFARANASFERGCFNYFKYDKHGRITENGILKAHETHTLGGYKSLAEDRSYPPSSESWWKKRYYYDIDANGDSANLKGRLYRVESNDNPVFVVGEGCHQDPTAGVTSNSYKYDFRGRTEVASLIIADHVATTTPDTASATSTPDTPGAATTQDILTVTSVRNTGYTYDNLGRTTSVIYPTEEKKDATLFDVSGQTTVYYGINSIGQLEAICGEPNCRGDSGYTTGYEYDINGLRVSHDVNLESETRQTRKYDLQGRLEEIRVALSGASQDASLFKEKLVYQTDATGAGYQAGNIIRTEFTGSLLGDSGSHSYDYEYDIFGRLVKATRNAGAAFNGTNKTFDYAYDPNDNMTSKTVATTTPDGVASSSSDTFTYEFGNRLHQVTGSDGSIREFDYSETGAVTVDIVDLAARQVRVYKRELATDRIYEVDTNDHTIYYRYDALGNRIGETIDNKHHDQLLIAEDDNYIIDSGSVLSTPSGDLPNIIDNDISSEGIEVILDAYPTHGYLNLFPDGTFTYLATREDTGDGAYSDSFTYQLHRRD